MRAIPNPILLIIHKPYLKSCLFAAIIRPRCAAGPSPGTQVSRACWFSTSRSAGSYFSALCASAASSQAQTESGGVGRSGALTPPPVTEVPQKIEVNPPKGTRDFPPVEMRLRITLFGNFREVWFLIRFQGCVGLKKLIFGCLSLKHCSLEKLVKISDSRKSVSLPLKWFAVGQCWRYERMTRGRRREHCQWNLDNIGVPEVTAEAELISAIVTLFRRIWITKSDGGFKFSSRKVLQEVMKSSDNCFGKVYIIIDKIEKIPRNEIKKELEILGMSDDAIEEVLQGLSIKSLDKLEKCLDLRGEAIADLKYLFSLAEKFGYSDWIQFDAFVVRGLAYYTGIVFEGFDRQGKLRAICGGGRYDRLLSTFGGDDIPACGFGFGDAVIVKLLKEKVILPELNLEVENIVCALDQNLQGAASSVAAYLKGKGTSC